MAVIFKTYTFGADICDGCGKKNKNWQKKNFHNKKCLSKFIKKTSKLYDKIVLSPTWISNLSTNEK